MIDQRALQIYQILFDAKRYVPPEELCESLKIRPRTLRECLRENNELLFSACGASVVTKPNQGYLLDVPDREAFQDFLTSALQESIENEYASPITQEGRVDYIIRRYLSSRDYLKYEDIADSIYTSRTTVYNDLRLVKDKLAEYDLQLVTKSGYGQKISGAEKNITRCIADYFFYDPYKESEAFQTEPLGRFRFRNEAAVKRAVDDALDRYHYMMSDVGRENLIIHLIISLYRIDADDYLSDDNVPQIDMQKNSEAAAIAKDITASLEKDLHIRMPESEQAYIVAHLLGSRVFDMEEESLITAETINLVRRILSGIYDSCHIDFFQDIDLFTLLSMHLQPMISRISAGLRMYNPILDQIRRENPQGYDLAVFAGSIISDSLHKEIDENEIGYLALHFQLALERQNKQTKKKNIITVCASGAGMSNLLSYRLEKEFAGSIGEIKAAGMRELERMDLSGWDLIVSTIPLKMKLPLPVVTIGFSLGEEDIRRLNSMIYQDDTDMQFVRSAFDRDLYFTDCDFSSKEEVLLFLCKKMAEKIALPEGFLASVREREKLASTDLGSGAAIPHPLQNMTDQTCIAVCHLKKPVNWGRQDVSFVLLSAVCPDDRESYAFLSRTLFGLISSKDSMKELLEHPDYDSFLSLFEQKGISVKKDTEGSIFR